MHCVLNDCLYDLLIPLDGTMTLHSLTGMIYTDKVLLSAYFKEDNILCIRFRWIETCFTKELQFSFDEEGCTVSEEMINGSDPQLETGVRYHLK